MLRYRTKPLMVILLRLASSHRPSEKDPAANIFEDPAPLSEKTASQMPWPKPRD